MAKDFGMNAIILSGIVLTVLLLSVLVGKRNKLYADRFLIIYLSFSLLNYCWLYLESIDYLQNGNWILLSKVSYLLNAPLFFFYVYALAEEKRRPMKYYLLMLLPALAYVIHFFYFDWYGFEGKNVAINNGLLYINTQLSLSWTSFVILFMISDPLYLIFFYFLLKKYRKRLLNSTSSIDHINLNWITLLFYTWFVPAILLIPVSVFSVGSHRISMEIIPLLLTVTNVVSTFIIGYYGFKQTTVFSDLKFGYSEIEHPTESVSSNEVKSSAYERSGLSKEQAKISHQQLLLLMEDKKPFLNGELNAADLAEMLGVSVNHLSQILSQEQKQNFFDFVNHYRVAEVKEKMKSDRYRHLTLLAMALESGFNSKTSFNTLFKKFTHQTPSQYYRSLSKD